MELTWPIAIIGWFVALLAGGGGVALIHRIYVRPKVYSRAEIRRLVPQRGDPRHQRAERILKEQGLPTAIAEVAWWNSGKRTAEDIVVEVNVPGEIVEVSVTPEEDNIDAPWEMAKRPEDYDEDCALRITQPELKPEGEVHVTVGFEAGDKEEGTISGYFSNREIADADTPSRRLLTVLPALLLGVGVFVWMGVMAVQEADSLVSGLLQLGAVLGISVAIGGVGLLLIGGWHTWVEDRILKPPSQRK